MTTMRFLSLVGNSFGCSASGERLVSAARDGDLQEAKALLEYNPRLARYSTFGVRNSPLHYSAAQGHHEIVLLLIESGVDINLRNYRGQTALMLACQYGHWEVVQILILFQANIHTTDCLNGGTALHLAALNGNTRCIRLLLADHIPSIPNFATILRKRLKNDKSVSQFDEGSLYATINKASDGGVTALHMAALNCHVETVHLLLDLGASVSNTTLLDGDTIDLIGAGSTPLHYAACGGNTQCCQLLIARGASLTTENAKGWTPLAVARSWHRDWLEDILTPESSGRRRLCHSPYLCLPLMSIVEIARECGWRGGNDTPTASDPCVVCLERKCTVAGQGCFHELCTRCALYLCSTNSTSTVADGPPGAIPCPLCRQGIISFVKLAGTKPKVKEMSRTRSMPLQPCSGTQLPAKTGSIETALSKPEFLSPLNSPFKSVGCQSFASSKFKPGLCLGGTDRSPALGPINVESRPPARNQLVKYSRSRSLIRRTASQNEGRRWLCSFTQSMPPGSS